MLYPSVLQEVIKFFPINLKTKRPFLASRNRIYDICNMNMLLTFLGFNATLSPV